MPSRGPVESDLLRRVERSRAMCAALIDPEDYDASEASRIAKVSEAAGAGLILVGGSTLADQGRLDKVVKGIKKNVTRHVILFPGNITGVSQYADAILFSSLLNSTNPYFIIGAQALGSVHVLKSRLESIPMGYLVFGSGSATSFVGQANAIPTDKPNLAVMYALAAQFLGMRTLYLEAGSGASQSLPRDVITAVRKYYRGLLIVGGGITSPEKAREAAKGGADIIVVGNLLAQPGFESTLRQIVQAAKIK
ncbi:MAG: geranylgeranylglyceryl/heptaprenylglyceryl phosphate synthase [Thaumarchaeota archaeon]|nr:geranylgeranylglyceryl/heptaprenylglyceryl phosphate synthase [Nitrososphaerota archaeon]